MNQHGTSRVPFLGRCPECGSVEAISMWKATGQMCLSCGQPFCTTLRCESWPRFLPVSLRQGRATLAAYPCDEMEVA